MAGVAQALRERITTAERRDRAREHGRDRDAGAARAPVPYGPHLLVALALFAAYAVYSLNQYDRFAAPSWDLAIFEQVVRSYAGLRAPVADVKGPGFLILGDHFSPLLASLAPLYLLWSDARVLLLAQAALFAGTAVVVGRTTQELLGSRAAGVCVGLAYGLSFGMQEAVKADFHEIALAVPLIALSCRAVLRRRWWVSVAWAAPLVLVKEDLGLTLAALGAVLAGHRQWRPAAVAVVGGTAAFLLTVLVLIPAASGAGEYAYWTKVEEDGGKAVGLGQTLVAALTNGTKWETAFFLLAITAFLALRSPLVLLVLPTAAWRFVSHEPSHWGMPWHYSAILMPVLFLALADAVARSRASRHVWLASYARVAPPVVLAVALAMAQHLPLRDVLRPDSYEPDARARSAARALAAIPEGASVETNTALMAHLTSDHTVYWVGGAEGVTPDVVAIDLEGGWSSPVTDPLGYARGLHPEADYRLVHLREGFAVMARQRLSAG